MAAMRLLWSPWREDLFGLISDAQRSVDLAVPYISPTTVSEVLKRLGDGVRLRVLTTLDDNDFRSGIAKLTTFRLLGRRVQVIRNLHAKLYIVDEQRAVLGSANLTEQGLGNNVELGVLIEDASQLREICEQYIFWWQHSKPVNYRELLRRVAELPKADRTATGKEQSISAMAPRLVIHDVDVTTPALLRTNLAPVRDRKALSKVLAPAGPKPGMRLLFDFFFEVNKSFRDCSDHVKRIPVEFFDVVSEERLADLPVEVRFPDGWERAGSIKPGDSWRSKQRRRERHCRIRVHCERPCAIQDHLQIGQKLHVEVFRGDSMVRVDLRPEEPS